MEMDDDDLKIRRNLVMFSAAVLLLAWLDIPFSSLLAKLIEYPPHRSDNVRLWTAGLAILLYLGVRYSFSADGNQYRDEVKREINRHLVDKAMTLVRWQANYFTWTGREPQVFSGNLTSYIQERGDGVEDSIQGCGRPKIELSMADYGNAPWRFSVGSVVTWYRGEKQAASVAGGYGIDVSIRGIDKFLILTSAYLHVLLYSASSVKYLAPVALGFGASVLLAFRVFEMY